MNHLSHKANSESFVTAGQIDVRNWKSAAP
jgi:hypothetical protein